MVLEAATKKGAATAPAQKPVEITPETTAKQLAAAVGKSGEDVAPLLQNAAWLRAGPFSGQIIQSVFGVSFKGEEVSENPVETLAKIYMKIRRHWPVYPKACVVWLLGVMRDWWGGLPVDGVSREPPRVRPRSDGEDDDEDWEFPQELNVTFSTTGATAHVPVTSDYECTLEFTEEDQDAMREIRRRYVRGELTKSGAISAVIGLIDERTRDCYYSGSAEDNNDHWDDEYADVDRDDESIESIASRDEAVCIVDAWA